MQALEKTYVNDNWITFILVFLLFLIFLLKAIDHKKLIGYALSPISKNFIEDELEENRSFFNVFQIVILLFSLTTLALVGYKTNASHLLNLDHNFSSLLIIFGLLTAYFFIKWGLEYLLSLLFELRKSTKFFFLSKISYLYSISFLTFGATIIVQYSQLGIDFLTNFLDALFILRFLLHLFSNKKLIFSKLFYFILYFCAFEIAPLLIIFKLMF